MPLLYYLHNSNVFLAHRLIELLLDVLCFLANLKRCSFHNYSEAQFRDAEFL